MATHSSGTRATAGCEYSRLDFLQFTSLLITCILRGSTFINTSWEGKDTGTFNQGNFRKHSTAEKIFVSSKIIDIMIISEPEDNRGL